MDKTAKIIYIYIYIYIYNYIYSKYVLNIARTWLNKSEVAILSHRYKYTIASYLNKYIKFIKTHCQ